MWNDFLKMCVQSKNWANKTSLGKVFGEKNSYGPLGYMIPI